MEIRADHSQQYLLPPAIEDWVPEEHPARFIRDFVESLDMKDLGFRTRKVEQGRPNYSAELLLTVWLYGYMEGIRSSRGVEKACRNQMGLIWLTGCHYPDHNTLWRFFRDNKEKLEKVFKQSVRVAQGVGLVGLVLHAVDGTKIPSVASNRQALHREDLKNLLERVDESIAKMMLEVEEREVKEEGGYRLTEELQDAKKRRTAIEEELVKLNEEDKKHHNPVEPEARMMRVEEGRERWAYNAQAVVDKESGMVVAETVTNEEVDFHQLVPMLERVEENLGEVAEETVADTGYRSREQLGEAYERGYEVLVNPHPDDVPKEDQFHVSEFTYDRERDCCSCPAGKVLKYAATEKGTGDRVYYCRESADCSLRDRCSRAKRGRKIKISPHHEAVVHQREKRKQPEKQEVLRQRKAIVEPVFGWIKQGMGFRRWTVRGLSNVQAQWALLCLTVNLKKLLPHWLKGRLVLA